jgi:Putative beta-barrel porin 2
VARALDAAPRSRPPQALRARPARVWIAAVAFPAVLATWTDPARGEAEWRPSVTVSQEFSDNIDLDPEDEQSAFVTRVTPALGFRNFTSRFRGGFDGAIGGRYTTEGDDEGFDLNGWLTADGELKVVRDLLLFEGNASVSQEVLDNDEAQAESNLDTVQVYRFSPVLRNRLGDVAVVELRYIFSQILVSSDDVSDATGHAGQASIGSGTDFDRLRWLLKGRISEAIRSEDSNVSRADVDLETEYAITRSLSAIAGGGYQSFDEGDPETDFDSPAYRGGLRWRPGRRTELVFTYGKRDDRFSPAASLRYRITEEAQFLASYVEGLSTSQERLTENLAAIGIDRETGEFIDQRSDTRFDPRPDPFDIDDETEYIKAARADLTFSRGRYSAGLRGYLGREEQVATGDEEDVWRIDAVLSRQIGRQLSVDLSGGFERIEFEDGREDDEYRIQPGVRYLLGPRASLFIDYRYLQQDSNDPTAEYTENRVGAGLRMAW